MKTIQERINELQVEDKQEYDGIYLLAKTLVKYKNLYSGLQDLIENCYKLNKTLLKLSDNNINIYISKLRNFLINLDPQSHVNNKDIEKLLTANTIFDLCKMHYTDLYPSIWNDIIKELDSKYNQEKLYTVNKDIKCKYCGSNNIIINVVQTRSVDEGSTIVIECNSCGKIKKN